MQDPTAAARCDEIQAEGLRSECVALAALERAEHGELAGAQALCSALAPGSWRDECHFLACDGADLLGSAAIQCCRSAGQFRRRCLGHAISRDGMTAFEAVPPGQETAGLAAVEAVVAQYQGPDAARHKAEQIVRAALLLRAPEGPLTVAVCGDIAPEICAQVYEEMLRQATRSAGGQPSASLRAGCGRAVDRERVRSLGLPVWESALDAVAADAWARVCRR